MKKARMVILGILFACPLLAQETTNPELSALILNERKFAQMAHDVNTRDAFLAYLDDECVLFKQGPIIGKKNWEEAKSDSSWLWWEPDFADISAGADFGVTAGPWEFRTKRSDENPVAYGHFVSVWIKKNNIWKLAVDLGISHSKPDEKNKLTTSNIKMIRSDENGHGQIPGTFKVEKEFIQAIDSIGIKAYSPVLSSEARMYRKGNQPFVTNSSIQNYFTTINDKIKFTPVDGLESHLDDYCVYYGTATIEKKDKSIQQANYSHIWKKENGTWKLMIEVVSTW